MNPIIYSLSSKEFKRAFIRILHCKFKRKPRLFLNADSVSLSEYRKWSRSLTELRKISTDYRPRVSFSGSQHSEEHVNATETDVSIYRRNSGSPMTSLRVLPNHRATFAVNASNKDMLDISEQPSSNSELADDENSDASSYLSDQRLRRAVIKVSSDSQIVGSFEKDENYINAFRNGKNQTVL